MIKFLLICLVVTALLVAAGIAQVDKAASVTLITVME